MCEIEGKINKINTTREHNHIKPLIFSGYSMYRLV